MLSYIIVCPLVFLAGFIDSIAGGGGLVSLPAYLLAGIPIHNAIATNKLSSCIGTSVSTIRYCKNGFADFAIAIPSILMALTGSALGARLSLSMDEQLLKNILLIILPFIAFFTLRKKHPTSENNNCTKRSPVFVLACIISFVVGMYDGFYGPGTGSFLILLYTGLCKMDIRTAKSIILLFPSRHINSRCKLG